MGGEVGFEDKLQLDNSCRWVGRHQGTRKEGNGMGDGDGDTDRGRKGHDELFKRM